MLINFLEKSSHVEISYSVKYKYYDIVVRQIVPTKLNLHPWFSCYINNDIGFTEEVLDSIPSWCGVTYNSVYADSWVKSNLTNRWVIGWDYNHNIEGECEKSVQDILDDAYKVIDYLELTLTN